MGWPRRFLIGTGVAAVAVGATASLGRFSYAPLPDQADLLNADRYPIQTAFDILGRRVSRAEADRLNATESGRTELAPGGTAVAIGPAMVERGRQAFYQETFGNEVFLTDVTGMLDGGLTPTQVALAVAKLGGQGTTNLQVAIASDMRVGDRLYKRASWPPPGSTFRRVAPSSSGSGRSTIAATCAWASPARSATPRSIPAPARWWRARRTSISTPDC